MITASGNINSAYTVLGVATVSVVKPEKTGCNAAGLPVDEAYGEAVKKLVAEAERRNGDGVIHIGFEHRISSSSTGCASSATSNFELCAWGTVIRQGADGQH